MSESNIYCRFYVRDNPALSIAYQDYKRNIDVPPSQMLKVCTKRGSAINNDDVYCYSCGTKCF
ncbi:MAG: hypothetical protein WBL67_06305 [Nitrososphaeraceae archaeon]